MECGDPGVLLGELEVLVLEGRFDEAEGARERLIGAFGCGELATPDQIARMWLAEALILASDDVLAAAARLSPTTWNELYGPGWKARWEAASQRPAPQLGRVDLGELPEGYVGAIDGTVTTFPATLPAGPHLLQVLETQVVAVQRFDLPAGLDLVLQPALPLEVEPSPRKGRRILHALLLGAGSGLTYGATFATSASWSANHSESLRVVNNGLVVSAGGLALTSGVLLVRGVATSGSAGDRAH
jgi:hypothetical protein